MGGDPGVAAGTSPLQLGISAGVDILLTGMRRLGVRHREIPTWILDIDPDFAAHGGAADRIELHSLENAPSEGLFDLPEKFKRVSHF
jgi:hypothetical protein